MTTTPKDEEKEMLPMAEELLPEYEEFQLSLDELLKTGRMSFADGDQTFYIRQPGSNLRDEGTLIYSLEKARLMQRPDVQELAVLPLPQYELDAIDLVMMQIARRIDVEEERFRLRWWRNRLRELDSQRKKSAADGVIHESANVKRTRFFAEKLLVDEEGNPIVTHEHVWEDLSPTVQDAATKTAAKMLRMIYLIPFASEAQNDQE